MNYILNGVNYQTLILMLADAPRYVKEKKNKTRQESADELVGFFQSKLK